MEKLNITIQPRHATFHALRRTIYVNGHVAGELATLNPFEPDQPDYSDQLAEMLTNYQTLKDHIKDLSEEWVRVKELFPEVEKDGWMDSRMNLAMLSALLSDIR